MATRGIIMIDITGLQSEDMANIQKTIQALNGITYSYNSMDFVGIDEELVEKIFEQDTSVK